jgi:hypothetical protein
LRFRARPYKPARGSADELPIPTLQQLCTGAGFGAGAGFGFGVGAGDELPTPTLQDCLEVSTGLLSVVQDVFSFEQPHVI